VKARVGLRGFVIAGLAVALLLGAVVSRWASTKPDGLEKVAADNHIGAQAAPTGERFTPVETGLLGVTITFAIAGGLLVLVRRSSRGRSRRAEAA
jgi:hypothetical protein